MEFSATFKRHFCFEVLEVAANAGDGRDLATGRYGETASAVTRARLGLNADGTARYLVTLADPAQGLIPDGRLDAASLDTLRILRVRHAAPGVLADANGNGNLVDERFLVAQRR